MTSQIVVALLITAFGYVAFFGAPTISTSVDAPAAMTSTRLHDGAIGPTPVVAEQVGYELNVFHSAAVRLIRRSGGCPMTCPSDETEAAADLPALFADTAQWRQPSGWRTMPTAADFVISWNGASGLDNAQVGIAAAAARVVGSSGSTGIVQADGSITLLNGDTAGVTAPIDVPVGAAVRLTRFQ